jgi:sporulation integral membrane protein YtvI
VGQVDVTVFLLGLHDHLKIFIGKKKIISFLKKQIPQNVQDVYSTIKSGILSALWGYIKAQLILMCITGACVIIGLSLLGYKYALLIGLITAVLDALPVIGPGFILWPWIAVCLLGGRYHYALGLLVIYIICVLIRQFLEPKILSTQIGIYPLITITSIYAGLMLLGPMGLLAGPVFVVIVKTLQTTGLLPGFK